MATKHSRRTTDKASGKQRSVTSHTDSSSDSGEALSPEELARALRAVAAELERDPALARRVAGAMRLPASDGAPPAQPESAVDAPDDAPPQPVRRGSKTFKPKLVTGAAPTLGTGIPDPFALREQVGEDGLRMALADLRLGTLRAIVREYGLDSSGQLMGQNDDAKFRALILRATKRPKRG